MIDGDSAALRKRRGAFFTPPEVAAYVTEWAVRSMHDTVLEPSCGEAAFLLPAARRLRALGAGADLTQQLQGAELHVGSADRAVQLVAEAGATVTVRHGDFLMTEPEARFDAVIGNPPYVRYQSFAGESRAAARRAALRAGVSLSNLASSWAAFTVHSALHLRKGGRLGLVLPAEILSVNYAAPVRDFLMREFQRVRLILFTERVFPGVMEDVVLLLAEGRGAEPAGHCELVHARNASGLARVTTDDIRRWSPAAGGRWSLALVNAEAGQAYSALVSKPLFERLEQWGDTTLGMVTGSNQFFALSGAEVTARGLSREDVIPLSPPGSHHLRSSIDIRGLSELEDRGLSTWLFRPQGEPSKAGLAYIRQGEKRGVHEAYKCRVRSPWWRTPYLKPADLFLTYMNADVVRLVGNSAGAHHLNSVHGVYLSPGRRGLGRELLPLAALNSITLLGAELVGRSYGGGVLKMEPREADLWPMPSRQLLSDSLSELRAVRPLIRNLLIEGRLLEASQTVDQVLFDQKIDTSMIRSVRMGRAALHDRRAARSRSR